MFLRNSVLKLGINFVLFKGCNCNPLGCKGGNTTCDPQTKQCDCECSIQGLNCDECTDMHYNFPFCETTCKIIW